MLVMLLLAGSQSFAQEKHHRKNKKQLKEQELTEQKHYEEADLFARLGNFVTAHVPFSN